MFSGPLRWPVQQDPDAPVLVSASQLRLFMLGCERKWGFQYILGLKTPQTKSTALGSAVHKMLEEYLRDGKPLDFTYEMPGMPGMYPAEIAAQGLQYLPEPKDPRVAIEEGFTFEVPELPGVVFRGFVDLAIAPGADGIPEVRDHKTCGNWDYALKADDLRGDIQAIIYAKYALLECPDAQAVKLQWTYFGTKKPYRSRPVMATVSREHVEQLFAEVVVSARELATTLRSNRQPLELPANASECDKYGGCPFRGKCNLSPKERRPFMSDTVATQNLLDRIKAKTQGSTAAPATGGLAAIQAKIAEAKAKAQAAPAAPQYAPGSEPAAPADLNATAFAPAAPAAPPRLPETDQPVNCPTDYQPPPATIQDIDAQAAATVAELVPEAAPKAKGRPKGSKNNSPAAPAVEGLDVEALNAILRMLVPVLGRVLEAIEREAAKGQA